MGQTFRSYAGHTQHVCLYGGSSLTGGGSKMQYELQKHAYE